MSNTANSHNKGDEFSVSDITNNSYGQVAVQLAQLELVGGHSLLKLILPLAIVVGIFFLSTVSFHIPGVSKSTDLKIQESQRDLNYVQDETLKFLNDYNGIIITANGFIISILGGFLVTSGSFNFYFFLGFEIIVISLIFALLAYPSFISFSNLTKAIKADKKSNESMFLPRYFKLATFASAFLILGLATLVSSLTV